MPSIENNPPSLEILPLWKVESGKVNNTTLAYAIGVFELSTIYPLTDCAFICMDNIVLTKINKP